ncbi:Rpn family recombination-promoting nuclease/putative transposase [Anaerosporobacter sp.]|uniref:Rpn family recombination-promoting nuclease/putative transposase n=1 Tax=Anaerosporobacter sp. TaxID=1872529 RepID=UPI00286F7DB4|nr:Rpn family recombination-promoting nuclease/putative transposase [Anaerosporobacter sp.]
MENKILKPTNDLIFKLIFGDNRNIDILASFLQSVLNLPESEYSHLTIVDPYTRIEKINDKTSILDVKLHTKSGKIIDIEIQVSDVPQMKERIVFYTAKMITEQVGKGDNYNLKKVISIVITDYKIITENESYHNVYQLYDKNTNSKFTDVLEINTLELPKLPSETDNSSLWNWLRFLKADREEELTMLAQKSPEIYKAVGVLKELSQDERTKLLYESREKAMRDERARLQGAIENRNKEIVQKALSMGMCLEDISELTNLSLEEIKTIANEQ